MSMRVVKKEENILVGLAFADASQRQIGVSQFLDNDLFSNAEVSWTVAFISYLFPDLIFIVVLLGSLCSSNWE